MVGGLLQRPALVNTGNVRYWAATFYDQLAANLCSAVWRVRGPVTWQMATLVLIDVNNPLLLPSTTWSCSWTWTQDKQKSRFSVRRNWLALQRHCWLYCGPDGGEHHNCVKLTVATMTFILCEMTSDLTKQNVRLHLHLLAADSSSSSPNVVVVVCSL